MKQLQPRTMNAPTDGEDSAMRFDETMYLRWRAAFASAMDVRLYRPEWLDMLLATGRAQFWHSPNAAAVTEMREYPTGAYDVHGLIAAGNTLEVREIILPQIERWGRAVGALGIVIESRPGWARVLKPSGFAPHQLSVRKELHNPVADLRDMEQQRGARHDQAFAQQHT